MIPEEIIRTQIRVGTKPDGMWGPNSIAACQRHLRAMMPIPNPWPKADRMSVERFFGPPGEKNLESFEFPYPMYYEGKIVRRSRCHYKVKQSLITILKEIGNRYADKRGVMEEAEDYGGIFNFRNTRGGNSLSMHAWGIAIDLDADDNGNKVHWPTAADMPIEIMEIFAKEGWTPAGAFWHRDAMHFQATQP